MNFKTLALIAATGTIATAGVLYAMDDHHHHDDAHAHDHDHDMMDTSKAISQEYSDEAFMLAQEEGLHIVVDVWKQGCPTCKAQHPTLESARETYPDAVFFKVNFETQKDAVAKFEAVKQSTIIVFNGEEETGRVLGETDADKLMALIATGATPEES